MVHHVTFSIYVVQFSMFHKKNLYMVTAQTWLWVGGGGGGNKIFEKTAQTWLWFGGGDNKIFEKHEIILFKVGLQTVRSARVFAYQLGL